LTGNNTSQSPSKTKEGLRKKMSVQIQAINDRLRAANIGINVLLKGSRLYLQATFPPKPNSPKNFPHQQTLSLGIYANSAGIKRAEKEAIKIGGLIACKEFSWLPYLKPEAVPNPRSLKVKDLVQDLEQDYFGKRKRTPESETTWKDDYMRVYRKLPSECLLTIEILKREILATKPDTRTRRRVVLACNCLARFAELNVDFSEWIGSYNIKSVNPRSLPTDEFIAETYHRIVNPRWKLAYALMAVYGIRNYEIWKTSILDYPVVWVDSGKTENSRIVCPLYPEWAENWIPCEIWELPISNAATNTARGGVVTKAFSRSGIPFAPYNLRHAWAARAFEFDIEVGKAAAQMGHSETIHRKVYQRWIDRLAYVRDYERLLSKPNRPIAPMPIQELF
jgi:integrase